MRIVQFRDGSYGIKRGFIFPVYADNKDTTYWWTKKEYVMKHCRFSSLEEAKKRMEYLQTPFAKDVE